ncbi:hypothetical protein VNI00_012077 [Paramarasmius palmivorus]|uniref:Ribonuclease H1 N-terminal domain-containing protein n=1 Tax=Paramarasmius palmivorus TaxID=297713 RepID=A0AAW0C9W0_9AGAR
MSQTSQAPYPVPYIATSGHGQRNAPSDTVNAPRTYTISDFEVASGVTTVRTTIERIANLVITTTISIAPANGTRLVGPEQNAAFRAQQEAEVAQDREHDIVPPFTNVNGPAGVLTTAVVFSTEIPHPSTLEIRAGMEFHNRFYVVYRGKEVGIFYDFHSEVAPRTLGVSNALMKAYDTWEDAITEYARAYRGLKPGHRLAVIGNPNLAGGEAEWHTVDDDLSLGDDESSITVDSLDTTVSTPA